MRKKIILIGGPTGVGKTKLGILCANKFNGEIISTDSIAIYKHLDIGSAKPNKEEQKMAVHHQIDIVEPNSEYSVSNFVEQTRKIIDDLISKNKLPILVGGTGLFMKSLLYPYNFGGSDKNEEIRKKYTKMADENSNEFVYNILKEIDPISASKIHSNDLKRVVRAIEIYETTGKPKSNNEEGQSLYDFMLIFLNGDRTEIYNRINERVDNMINLGLEDEIKTLIKDYGLTRENQSMQGIGYKEWFDYFDGKISYEELIEKIKINSRHYAKRQITWFKAMPKVREYNYKNVDKITADIEEFLSK